MVEVTVDDIKVGDMVTVEGKWDAARPVAAVSGDNVLTGTPNNYRWDTSMEWLRERPYSAAEWKWYRPIGE